MATIIDTRIESEPIDNSYSFWKFLLIGAFLGLLFSGFVELIKRFTNSETIPGDVSTILVAVVGILVMVRFGMVRPLIISIASSITLWGITSWTVGLTLFEAIFWFVTLHAVSYLVFSWLVRYIKIIPTIFIVAVCVIIIRICLIL